MHWVYPVIFWRGFLSQKIDLHLLSQSFLIQEKGWHKVGGWSYFKKNGHWPLILRAFDVNNKDVSISIVGIFVLKLTYSIDSEIDT